MATEKQILARKINYARGRILGQKALAYEFLKITNNNKIYEKWIEILDKAYENLKGAYL